MVVLINLPCAAEASKSSHTYSVYLKGLQYQTKSFYGPSMWETKASSISLDLSMPKYDTIVIFYVAIILTVLIWYHQNKLSAKWQMIVLHSTIWHWKQHEKLFISYIQSRLAARRAGSPFKTWRNLQVIRSSPLHLQEFTSLDHQEVSKPVKSPYNQSWRWALFFFSFCSQNTKVKDSLLWIPAQIGKTQVPECRQHCDCREPVKVLSTEIRDWVSPASSKHLNTVSSSQNQTNNFLQRAANIDLFWVKPLLFLWITFLQQAQEQENYSFEKARPHLISGHQNPQV